MGFSDIDSDSSLSAEKRKSHKHHKHDKKDKSHKRKHEKEKKEKKEHKHHKHEKEHKHHKHEKRAKHDRDSGGGGADVSAQAAAAWEAFAAVVVANPGSRHELRSLLQMLDEGQMVVLDSVADDAQRSRLQSALDALGLPRQRLSDGSIAHAKPDGATLSLASHFGSLFEGIAGEQASDDEAGPEPAAYPAADGDDQGPPLPGAAAAAAAAPPPSHVAEPSAQRRVYGVTMRPAVMVADAAGIGPSAPPGPSVSNDEDDEKDDEVVGPVLPAGGDDDSPGEGGGSSSAAGKKRWWEREQEAPKAATAIGASTGPSAAPLKHDEWMTALPTDRVGFDPIEARQFTRNGVQAKGDTSIWTDTGEDKARKASEQWVGGGASGGGGGGGGASGAPMTLADAVALAKSNAAAGKRPRPAGGGGGGGGSGGGGGPAAKSLVEVHADVKAEAKKSKKNDWEGQHPWKPWDRDTDLDIRAAKPKGKETILNDQIMGTLGDRFGGSGRRETTFM